MMKGAKDGRGDKETAERDTRKRGRGKRRGGRLIKSGNHGIPSQSNTIHVRWLRRSVRESYGSVQINPPGRYLTGSTYRYLPTRTWTLGERSSWKGMDGCCLLLRFGSQERDSYRGLWHMQQDNRRQERYPLGGSHQAAWSKHDQAGTGKLEVR